MLPYEILVGLRRTMCTCTRSFIVKQTPLKPISIKTQKLCTVSADVTSNLSSLRMPFKNVNINNIRRFHTQLSACSQSYAKDTKSMELSDNLPETLDDSMSSFIDTISKKKFSENKDENSTGNQNNTYAARPKVTESIQNWMFSTTEKIPSKDIEKKFPEPKAYLHNLYAVVANETNIPQVLSIHQKPANLNKKTGWQVSYVVKWPEETTFTSIAISKAKASSSAALKCLYWLSINGRIKNRSPVVYDKAEAKSIINSPEQLTVNENVLKKINEFLNDHEKNIQEVLLKTEAEEYTEVESQKIQSISHPISHLRVQTESRNQDLKQRLENRQMVAPPDLPIFQFRSQIINELENNQVVVIKGDTGCGKTTQVPQFIIDHLTEMGRGADCRMIVTQPRRISAISLAERVAFERGERVGDVVGYQVRLQQFLPKQDGAILFCTTGLLLKKLQSNLLLEGLSHVVVDEAHERNVDTDMLLVLLKRAIQKNPSLKVVIMSATINADLFQNYLRCNSVEVPGRLFPVEMNFLDDIERLGIASLYKRRGDRRINTDEDEGPVVDCDEITQLIQWICRKKPPGAILCFLPGWHHIQKVQANLESFSTSRNMVIPLHSKLPYITQSKIFSPAPQDVRKIILATDIAETGITVPDVVYVIDSACHKEMRWHESRGLSSIDTHWISKANINQRKGRAGRVQKGESYHFVTRKQYEELEPYPIPEVLRVSLEKTVLDCKTYSNETAVDFLGSMPQPPRLSAVEKAVEDLQTLGALDEDENLTPLGKRIALFAIHPKLSKAMVYAAVFQCLSPVTTISSVLSLATEIFYGTLDNKRRIRGSKLKFHPSSDHLALAWIYSQWANFLNNGPQEAYSYARRTGLHAERMMILHKVRDINLEHLCESGLIEHSIEGSDLDCPTNKFAVLDELIRGILLAGTDHILKHRNFEFKKGRFTKAGSSLVTEDNAKAQLTPESINYKRSTWPSPYLIYYQKTHHNERRTTLIRESSMISPVSVLLFSQGEIHGSMHNDNNNNEVLLKLGGKTNIQLVCSEETAKSLLRFRDIMWSVVQYYVKNNVNSSNKQVEIEHYRKQMLNVLATLLCSTSESIDSSAPEDSDEN